MKWIFFLLPFLFINVCIFSSEYRSQETSTGTRENILAFANYLFDQGDYSRAVAEYKRFIFMSNQEETEKISQVKFKIGICYQQSGELDSALAYFKKLKEELPKKSESIEFEIGRTYYLKKDYKKALEKFQGLLDSNKLSEYSQYMIGWCHLKQMDWQKAEFVFNQVKAEKVDLNIYTFSQDLARYSKYGAKLPNKSPFIAGLLSVLIPGGGQMYLQRLGDGIFSMIAILGTALLSNHYYQNNYKTTAYILGGLSVIFYAGNIYGAAASARLINISLRTCYLKKLEKIASEKGIIIEVWQ